MNAITNNHSETTCRPLSSQSVMAISIVLTVLFFAGTYVAGKAFSRSQLDSAPVPRLIAALDSRDHRTRVKALEVLNSRVFRVSCEEPSDEQIQQINRLRLAFPAVLKSTRDPVAKVRAAAIACLGWFKGVNLQETVQFAENTIPVAVSLLSDDSSEVRYATGRALGHVAMSIRSSESMELSHQKLDTVYTSAAVAVQALATTAVEDKNHQVRVAALNSLDPFQYLITSQYGPPNRALSRAFCDATRVLTDVLHDPEPFYRRRVVDHFGSLALAAVTQGDPDLRAAIRDAVPDVVTSALRLSPDPSINEALNLLARVVDDDATAAFALLRAVPVLIHQLTLPPEPASRESEVVRRLYDLPPESSPQESEIVRRLKAAAEALEKLWWVAGRHSQWEVTSAIQRALIRTAESHPNEYVRAEVMQVVQRMGLGFSDEDPICNFSEKTENSKSRLQHTPQDNLIASNCHVRFPGAAQAVCHQPDPHM